MKLSVISENTSTISDRFVERFGLGVVVRINGKTVLIDCGPDDSFLQNLSQLRIAVEDIDLCLITHGHYDHGGGLRAFLAGNAKAKVYLSAHCAGDYYSSNPHTKEYKYIGLDPALFRDHAGRIELIDRDTQIDEGISLFHIEKRAGSFLPKMNASLYVKIDGNYVRDDFRHELAILLTDGSKNVVITGCAHSGVTNMIDTVVEKSKLDKIDAIVGGFHLLNPATKTLGEDEENVIALARQLGHYQIGQVFTGHCTGTQGYEILRKHYPGDIQNITTGFEVTL